MEQITPIGKTTKYAIFSLCVTKQNAKIEIKSAHMTNRRPATVLSSFLPLFSNLVSHTNPDRTLRVGYGRDFKNGYYLVRVVVCPSITTLGLGMVKQIEYFHFAVPRGCSVGYFLYGNGFTPNRAAMMQLHNHSLQAGQVFFFIHGSVSAARQRRPTKSARCRGFSRIFRPGIQSAQRTHPAKSATIEPIRQLTAATAAGGG